MCYVIYMLMLEANVNYICMLTNRTSGDLRLKINNKTAIPNSK